MEIRCKGGVVMEYRCCITNCEYNSYGYCNYCGDFWSLDDKECTSFIDKNEGELNQEEVNNG